MNKRGDSMKNNSMKNNLSDTYWGNTKNLIKILRQTQHITQKELGKRLGLTQQCISKLENPNTDISLNTLSSICDQLNIFPLIYFEPHHYEALIDLQLITCFQSLKALSSEKQHLIFELIRILS